MEEVKVEVKPTVEAYGIGKTGFIDVPVKLEETKCSAPIALVSQNQTEKEIEVQELSQQIYPFPETDSRDYKEGKSTKPKTMQDLLLASNQRSELIRISPKKDHALAELEN